MRHLKFFSFGFLAVLTLGGLEHMRCAPSVAATTSMSAPADMGPKAALLDKN